MVKNVLPLVGLLFAALIGVGFYMLNTGAFTFLQNSSGGISLGGTGLDGADVEVINVENPSIPQPSLDREVTIDPAIPEHVAQQLRTNIQILTEGLRKDNMRMNFWMELGNNRRIAGDTEGALEVWTYITQVAPNHYLAYSNLGDLYMHTLKDYPKAEASFTKSIELKPKHVDGYRNLYMLYHYLYKTDTELDGDILAQGLRANPDNPDLLQLLGEYQAGR